MAEFTTKAFAGDTIPWAGSDCQREYLYGLCTANPVSGCFRRVPFLKPLNVYKNGHLMDAWPITANCEVRDATGGSKSVHPVVDPNWGFCAYGLNIRGSSIDTDDLDNIPTAAFTKGPGFPTAVNNKAIAWWNSSSSSRYGTFLVMPAEGSTYKVIGPKYTTFDSKIHVRNNHGIIEDTTNIKCPAGTFPYYTVDKALLDTSHFSGRSALTFYPSMFAVVQCVNCSCFGLAEYHNMSDINMDPSGTAPKMNFFDDGTNIGSKFWYTWKAGQGYYPVNTYSNAVGSNNTVLGRARQIYASQDGLSRVYFAWKECSFASSISSEPGAALFQTLPIAMVVPDSDAAVGTEMTVRIIQYGVEFNF